MVTVKLNLMCDPKMAILSESHGIFLIDTIYMCVYIYIERERQRERRKWHPHSSILGQRSLEGYSPWGCKE